MKPLQHFLSSVFFVIFLTTVFRAHALQDLSPIQASQAPDQSLFESPLLFDYIPDVNYEQMAQRFKTIEASMKLTFNPRVKNFVDYFTVRDREYTRMVARRANVYFPLFEKYLAKHGMPDDLKYLAIVESGLNPRAKSRVGAMGLWQFMPATGRMFKLKQDWYIDDRIDPEKATEAACLYLKELYGIFKDWELALASYNAGPGNVRKAITRSGGKRNFWDVYDHLPKETRSYVPQFMAIIYTMNHLEEHNLLPNDLEYAMDYQSIQINQFLSLDLFSAESGVCLEDLEFLNPSILRGAVPASATNFSLKIPAHQAPAIRENLLGILDASKMGQDKIEALAKNTPGTTLGREKIEYQVRSGDVIGRIAQRYNVREADIREWNNIRGNLIRVGQKLTLYVPSDKAPVVSTAVASTSNTSTRSSNGQMVHQVQAGDTLWGLSKKYQISVEEIKRRNNLSGNNIKPGQKLVIG
jgi:membrane-bound lytic murein transglycosylase D